MPLAGFQFPIPSIPASSQNGKCSRIYLPTLEPSTIRREASYRLCAAGKQHHQHKQSLFQALTQTSHCLGKRKPNLTKKTKKKAIENYCVFSALCVWVCLCLCVCVSVSTCLHMLSSLQLQIEPNTSGGFGSYNPFCFYLYTSVTTYFSFPQPFLNTFFSLTCLFLV